jgi:methionine synthase I (cobalamin-dependent)
MVKGLVERLKAGEEVLVAEGYLFEFERRGYLQAGAFVPEVALDHPDLLRSLYREFVHAGSDVVEAFTYYAHREKLRVIDREKDLEVLNKTALKIAKEVAVETGTLMAGNLSNSTIYDPNDKAAIDETYDSFKEQVVWAAEAGADFIIAETFSDLGEAKLALKAIKEHGGGVPSVVTFTQNVTGQTRDGYKLGEACRALEEAGADVVGLNCGSGPDTILPLMQDVKAHCKGPLACLPIPLRTTPSQPQMQNLVIPETGEKAFPRNLDYFYCTQDHIYAFGKECKEMGIQYLGLCCFNSSRHFRALAESVGRKPGASKFSTDMSKHYVLGNLPRFKKYNTEVLKNQKHRTAEEMKGKH